MIAKSGRRQVPERQRAVEQLRTVAKPYRLRVQVDAEGFPFIPGRHGQIEWHCDGVNCSSCLLPGQFALAVYSDRPRMFAKLWAIPGVKRDQTGDTEMRAVFPPEALEQVAAVVRAHRKPGITSEVAKKIGPSTAFGGTSRAEKARSGPTPSPGPSRWWEEPRSPGESGCP